jgi:hypothetical protein
MSMTVAKDDFDAPQNLNSYSQSPLNSVYSASRGFGRYQVGVSATIPFDLLDQTTSGSPSDTFGIVNPQAKTDGWFGVIDTLEAGENDTGACEATWQFNISGKTSLAASIDMGAVGDFEAGSDTYNWTYAIDGGAFQPLFTSSVNEAGAKTYTFANGNMATHQDPLLMAAVAGSPTELSNMLQTFTSAIVGAGNVLTLRLQANTNGQDEGYVFDNIVITGLVSFLASDFDKDGSVDSDDLAAWRSGFGIASGATKAQGDADYDGDVDSADLLVWQRQLGAPQPGVAVAAAVPEPAAGIVAFGAALGFAAFGGRRRR